MGGVRVHYNVGRKNSDSKDSAQADNKRSSVFQQATWSRL